MARRSRTTPAEAFVQVIALLPWWGCLAIGLISYVVLHRYAMLPVVMTPGPGQLTGNVFGAIGKGLASVGQYVIPILAIGAAVVSFANRRKRDTLLANATGNQSAEAIASMDWREFEMLTSEAFRLQGFSVTETAEPGADGGVDIVLRKAGETFLVQCKHWRAFKVPVETVRELYGLMASHGAAGGFVVTSGRFTDEAKAFAEGRNVRLIEGTKLRGLIQQARTSIESKAAASLARTDVRSPADPGPTSIAPICPACSRPMTLRTAKRGANTGNQFWGCTGYRGCKSTRPVNA